LDGWRYFFEVSILTGVFVPVDWSGHVGPGGVFRAGRLLLLRGCTGYLFGRKKAYGPGPRQRSGKPDQRPQKV
jgi:hypothetical protein